MKITTFKNKKINIKRLFPVLIVLVLTIIFFNCLINFVSFPEKYITTWKYQLQNEIKTGDVQAIKYYNQNYISKGIYLYGEDTSQE